MNYHNEIDPYAAQWLRNLISAGHIPPGDVDERSIVDVRPGDLAGYAQCHFFAGIGGWPVALRLAGWPDDRPVWTGSCPCQPFSAAGAGKAADDKRHLWPAWFSLIAECRPPVVFGEQVEAAVGWGWVDAVFADLEGEGYACGTTVLPACGVGAPHIRQRLWFVGHAPVNGGRAFDGQPGASSRWQEQAGGSGIPRELAHADGGDASAEGLQRGGEHGQRAQDGGAVRLADSHGARLEVGRIQPARHQRQALERGGEAGELGDPDGEREDQERGVSGRARIERSRGAWSDLEWLPCTDGKARPVEPGTFPLAHGIQRRTSKLRAYGNAIVPQVAAEFIRAAM